MKRAWWTIGRAWERLGLPPYPLQTMTCWARGGHRWHTHHHPDEPDVTYCLECRWSR